MVLLGKIPGNNKGQSSTVSHVLLWIVIIGIGAWLIYSATHTVTDNQKFAPGSTSTINYVTRWPLTIDLNFGCTPIGLKANPNPPTKEDKK